MSAKKSKVKSVNQFIKPSDFTISITRKGPGELFPLIEWLVNECRASFHYEWKMLELGEEFTLTIHDWCWADNLSEIAKLLPDYEYNEL